MQNNKFQAYIGFSIKSREIIYGSDNIVISKKNIQLVIIDETTNVKVVNKLISFCDSKNIMLIKSKFTLSELTTRDNVKVVGLLNKNLAKAIIENCSDDIIIIKEGENKIGK